MTTIRKFPLLSLVFILSILLPAACSRGGSNAPVRGQEQAPQFKAGFNLMSPQQDIEIGRQNAQQIEREMRVLLDPTVQQYVNGVGKRLAAQAPGEKFPYQFKVVDVKEINAFALPGGFLYVHTGAIVAAKNESELAGVMAHEISHVALRHGTNQLSKQMVAEKGLGLASARWQGSSNSVAHNASGFRLQRGRIARPSHAGSRGLLGFFRKISNGRQVDSAIPSSCIRR